MVDDGGCAIDKCGFNSALPILDKTNGSKSLKFAEGAGLVLLICLQLPSAMQVPGSCVDAEGPAFFEEGRVVGSPCNEWRHIAGEGWRLIWG